MTTRWLLLTALICLVVPACCQAVGEAGQGLLHGLADRDVPVGSNHQDQTVGETGHAELGLAAQAGAGLGPQNALGANVGVPEWIQKRLMNRETVGAAVGIPEQIRERLMEQNALGAAAAVGESIRERLTNRQTVAAAIGIPSQVRERLLGGATAE